MLTGQGDYEVDLEAMKAGAADFIAKKEMTGSLLDRSIRYALEQRRIMENLRASEGRCRLLASQLLGAQETERRNIAREIHDSIGGSLTAIKFKVEKVLMQLNETNPKESDSLREIIPLIKGAIDEARRIQMNLRPSILDDFGLLSTIGWFCRQFESAYTGIRIRQALDIQEGELSETLKTVIYRILQEAMNNIAKHSRATEVRITLKKDHQAIHLTVRDNGVGFNVGDKLQRNNASRGLGLESMRERAELSEGTFIIESTDSGTIIGARWPLGPK